MFLRKNRKRDINSHCADPFAPILRHGKDRCFHIFIRISKRLLKLCTFFFRILRYIFIRYFQVFQMNQIPVKPLAVRLFVCIFLFQFFIINYSSRHCIHKKHFPRMQPFLYKDPGRLDIQYAHLRRKNQVVVIGNIIPGRTKTVSVKHRAHHIAVREQNGGRSVPWLHHGSVVLIKVSLILRHTSVINPGLRNGNHHRKRKLHTAHYHKLQRIVQHSGIGTGCVYRRKNFVQFSFQTARLHRLFSRSHFICISPDCINFSVVHNKTVRMGSLPAWRCIGTES